MSAAPFVACSSHGPGHVIDNRGPAPGAVINGGQLVAHDVRPAPWATDDAHPASVLMWSLNGAGTVERLGLLDGALELSRREGAAEALEALAVHLVERDPHHAGSPLLSLILDRAELHRAGEL